MALDRYFPPPIATLITQLAAVRPGLWEIFAAADIFHRRYLSSKTVWQSVYPGRQLRDAREHYLEMREFCGLSHTSSVVATTEHTSLGRHWPVAIYGNFHPYGSESGREYWASHLRVGRPVGHLRAQLRERGL